MNRRDLFRSAVAGALLGFARHLPIPRMPEVERQPAKVEAPACPHGVKFAPVTALRGDAGAASPVDGAWNSRCQECSMDLIERMNLEWARTVFYGSAPRAARDFVGLTPRYSD